MYDRMRQDNARILGTGFSLAVVFTSPTGTTHPVTAFFSDMSLSLDANGMPVVGRKVTLTTHFNAPDGTVQFTEASYPNGPSWRVSFTYNGTAFKGEVTNAMIDRSFGSITMNAGKFRAAV